MPPEGRSDSLHRPEISRRHNRVCKPRPSARCRRACPWPPLASVRMSTWMPLLMRPTLRALGGWPGSLPTMMCVGVADVVRSLGSAALASAAAAAASAAEAPMATLISGGRSAGSKSGRFWVDEVIDRCGLDAWLPARQGAPGSVPSALLGRHVQPCTAVGRLARCCRLGLAVWGEEGPGVVLAVGASRLGGHGAAEACAGGLPAPLRAGAA